MNQRFYNGQTGQIVERSINIKKSKKQRVINLVICRLAAPKLYAKH